MHPASVKDALQWLTSVHVANNKVNKQSFTSSAAVYTPNWRVVCNSFTWLMMLLFSHWWQVTWRVSQRFCTGMIAGQISFLSECWMWINVYLNSFNSYCAGHIHNIMCKVSLWCLSVWSFSSSINAVLHRYCSNVIAALCIGWHSCCRSWTM